MKITNIYIFDFGNQIKIGQSRSVKQRLRNIETQSGREAVQHFSIKTDGKYENLMHKILSEYRGVGEYFAFPFDFAVSILKSLVKFEFVKEVKEGSQLFLPLVFEETAPNKTITATMNGMTISEMSKKLNLPRDTIKRRLLRAGRKPFSQEALYTEADFEAIKEVPGKGRPPKAKPEAPDQAPKAAKNTKK
jgi:hypothetical protein